MEFRYQGVAVAREVPALIYLPPCYEAQGASYDRIRVPGALEIPQALVQAVTAGLIPRSAPNGRWDGAVWSCRAAVAEF